MEKAKDTYTGVHLINRYKVKENGGEYLGLEKIQHPDLPYAYSSGNWVFSHAHAQSLLGGLIFLHEAKGKPAHFGGLIFGWQPVIVDDATTKERVIFHFLYASDALYADWQGAVHKQAWTGYIIEKDVPWKRTNPHGMPIEEGTGRRLSDIPLDYIKELQAKAKNQ